MTAAGRSLSVVIPALNEALGIGDICARVRAIRSDLAAVGVSELEILVVDDGSTDDTAAVAAAVPDVRVLRHGTNRGYGAAIKTGFAAAAGDLLGFLDADGTYPPESFPALCAALAAEDADLVVGSRMLATDSGMPRVRRIGNQFFARLASFGGAAKVTDSASGQRVLRRAALERLYPLPEGLHFTPVMTMRALHEGMRVVEVPIAYKERVGDSKLSVVRDGRRFLVNIVWTTLAYNPARVLGIIGLGAVATSVVLGLALVALRAAGVTVLGPTGVLAAFATLVFGVAGISLLNLGITFNYLVALFHKEPVSQGLFGRPIVAHLDRTFGWLGLIAVGAGLVVATDATVLGFHGWDITRLWLWLLGSALFILAGLQLGISWVLMRVLEQLAVRDQQVAAELGVGSNAATDRIVVGGSTVARV